MEKSDQKTAMKEIEEMKRQVRMKASARLFCCMHTGDKNFVYSMDNQERILDSYIEKTMEIVRAYALGEEVFLNFRKEAAEILCEAAIQRNELEWARYFAKKYRLDSIKIGV